MRLAVLINLAPRKRGSLEGWLIELCRQATRRKHHIDVYCRTPVHPEVAAQLAAARAGLFDLGSLEERPAKAVGVLAQYQVLHLDLLAPRSKVALLAYAAWPARVLYVAHSDYAADPNAALTRRLVRRALDQVSLARVEGLAGVSSFIRDKERARFHLPRWRVRTLHLGVDLHRFRPGPGALRRGVVLQSAAYLVEIKGFRHLLRALACLEDPEVRLRIAGDGPALPALERLADELGIAPRVEFLGLRDDLPHLLRGADIFVHPTLIDAFGLAVAEAMASGLPVIASDVGGVPELVVDGQTGLLVPAGDETGLAHAIARLASNPGLRARLGFAGAQRARLLFDARDSVARHLEWCESAAVATNRP